MTENRILVIDDDVELCELLHDYLTPEGFAVETANDPVVGLERALAGAHDMLVLDVMLPGLSGFEVLRNLRQHSPIPVLMLTARGDDVDRIVGLEMGADDYLPKPFNPRELVARIRAILRRSGGEPRGGAAPPPLAVGDVELAAATRTVRQDGTPVELTSVEFTLLQTLLAAAGTVVPRDELAQAALGRKLSAYDRSVDVHISSLRKKLGHRVGELERIRTVRGVGYLYALPPAAGN